MHRKTPPPHLNIENLRNAVGTVLRKSYIFWFFLIAITLNGCSEPLYKQQVYVFNTWAEVSIYGEDNKKSQAVVGEVLHEFERLQQMLHAWKPSELSQLNSALSQKQSANVSPELAAILKDATLLSMQSGGNFNPAIGKLISLWGFHADEIKPVNPSKETIAALVRENPRMSDITLNDKTVSNANSAVQIDLGDYAKVYALDRAVQLLKTRGIKNALINIGGNIAAMGEKGTRPWKIGIQHPRQQGPIAMLEIYDGETVATAGDYQRYFERDGKRYCDIIDSATGSPAQGVQAVTVVVKRGEHSSTLANAATKPLFIGGQNKWREAAQRMGIETAMLIDANGEIHITEPLNRRIEFRLPKPVVHEVP